MGPLHPCHPHKAVGSAQEPSACISRSRDNPTLAGHFSCSSVKTLQRSSTRRTSGLLILIKSCPGPSHLSPGGARGGRQERCACPVALLGHLLDLPRGPWQLTFFVSLRFLLRLPLAGFQALLWGFAFCRKLQLLLCHHEPAQPSLPLPTQLRSSAFPLRGSGQCKGEVLPLETQGTWGPQCEGFLQTQMTDV